MRPVRKGVDAGADLAEIQRVYERDFEAFVRAAAAICGTREAGRDAVQDAIVSAVGTRDQFRGEGTVEAWLWSAVVRTARKQVARRRTTVSLDDAEAQEADVVTPAALNNIRSLIASLPERQRLSLFLRYYGDLDYREIAEVLGVKTGTVSATLHAAHATLRAALEEVEHVRTCS